MRKVIVSGMNGCRSGRIAEFATVVAPGECLDAAAAGCRGSILILGDDALSVLDPREVGSRLRPPACILLAVPKFVAYATAARWREGAGAELVEPEDLESRVVQAASSSARKFLAPASWAPTPERLDSIAMHILLAIPRLEDLSAAGLARALGMKPRRLLRACASRFGKSPGGLLWDYRREYFLHRRREGAALAGIAVELGYANKSNLLRALRAHGVDLPSEGPGASRRGVRKGHHHVRK